MLRRILTPVKKRAQNKPNGTLARKKTAGRKPVSATPSDQKVNAPSAKRAKLVRQSTKRSSTPKEGLPASASSSSNPAATNGKQSLATKTSISPPAPLSRGAKGRKIVKTGDSTANAPGVGKSAQGTRPKDDSSSKAESLTQGAARTTDAKSAPATQLDPIQFPEEKPKKVKTHLTSKQLREFRELLLNKRAELAGDVRRLTSEALHRNDNGSNDHSTMPIHMADLGSDAWEQDFTLGLIANEEAVVREIDDALQRIDNKSYGICMATDKPISIARLYAKPWAKYCIEYARLREEGRAP